MKNQLLKDYDELGKPLSNCTFLQLVQKTEVELSKNLKFKLLPVSTLIL